MGRAKLQLELIKKEKARNITFHKRKKGLLKKLYEFSTLCDVDACMIIYGINLPPETWPPDPSPVISVANRYRALPIEERRRRSVDLSVFYKERTKKVNGELSKIHSSSSTRFKQWDPLLDTLSPEELPEVATLINEKLKQVKERILLVKAHMQLQQKQQQQQMLEDMISGGGKSLVVAPAPTEAFPLASHLHGGSGVSGGGKSLIPAPTEAFPLAPHLHGGSGVSGGEKSLLPAPTEAFPLASNLHGGRAVSGGGFDEFSELSRLPSKFYLPLDTHNESEAAPATLCWPKF